MEGGPFGAGIVRNGAIVARARNQVTNNDPAHTEIVALHRACAVRLMRARPPFSPAAL